MFTIFQISKPNVIEKRIMFGNSDFRSKFHLSRENIRNLFMGLKARLIDYLNDRLII